MKVTTLMCSGRLFFSSFSVLLTEGCYPVELMNCKEVYVIDMLF